MSVIDPVQGRGLGGVLLRHLTRHAIDNGIRYFTARMLAVNDSMLHLFEKLGTVTVTGRHGAELEIDVELPVTRLPDARAGAAQRGDRPPPAPVGWRR